MKPGAKKNAKRTRRKDNRLYALEVFIVSGPSTEKFIEQNPVISRTIEIRGDQTLQDLHEAIFTAFDRYDEHLYEFQFGEGPHDPNGKRYVLALPMDFPFAEQDEPAGYVADTTIGSLGLKVDQAFGYWFDFGDDWWHQINVVAIQDEAARGKYPRVTKRIGEGPPQYVDWDEEDEED